MRKLSRRRIAQKLLRLKTCNRSRPDTLWKKRMRSHVALIVDRRKRRAAIEVEPRGNRVLSSSSTGGCFFVPQINQPEAQTLVFTFGRAGERRPGNV
jgi:hypothetical protein